MPDKGGDFEEALRSYFIESGYFAVRGVEVRYADTTITDIDVWIYVRASALHRIRANVDAKNRTRSKSFERVLWAKGLQVALGLEEAIVATRDAREEVVRFGQQHGVQVLGGAFLDGLLNRAARNPPGRLTEEEMSSLLSDQGLDKLHGGWFARVTTAKARLVTHLDFSGCNAFLSDAMFFLSALGSGDRPEAACRCAYLMLSYFLVTLDHRLSRLAFEPIDSRRFNVGRGFALGENGAERTEYLVGMLREAFPDVARTMSRGLEGASDQRSAILAEFFSRPDIVRMAFETARKFEALAYAKTLISPRDLDVSLKGPLAVIIDAHGLDRAQFV